MTGDDPVESTNGTEIRKLYLWVCLVGVDKGVSWVGVFGGCRQGCVMSVCVWWAQTWVYHVGVFCVHEQDYNYYHTFLACTSGNDFLHPSTIHSY